MAVSLVSILYFRDSCYISSLFLPFNDLRAIIFDRPLQLFISGICKLNTFAFQSKVSMQLIVMSLLIGSLHIEHKNSGLPRHMYGMLLI